MTRPSLTSAKVVLRCRDFAASREFYGGVLSLSIVDEWEEDGGRGCIFAVDTDKRGGYIEIYEMVPETARYQKAFSEPIANDKVDLQLRADSVDPWVDALEGIWPFHGPKQLPWGQRWITLRDPDGLLIAIYEGSV